MSSLFNQIKLYKRQIHKQLELCGCCFVCRGRSLNQDLFCQACHRDLPWRSASPRLEQRLEFVDAAFAPFRYEFPIADLVKAAKFHRDLSALLALNVGFTKEFLAELGEIDFLVPVPLAASRFVHRGFNQAAEIARVLSARLHRPVQHALVSRRQSWGKAQSLLGATARRENIKYAFQASSLVAEQRIAIVDDVVTTGATCSAIARVLKDAGASKVIVVASAVTSLGSSSFRI